MRLADEWLVAFQKLSMPKIALCRHKSHLNSINYTQFDMKGGMGMGGWLVGSEFGGPVSSFGGKSH